MSNDQIQINPQGEIVSRRATTAVGALLSATVLASGSAVAQPVPDGAGVAQQGDVVIDEIGVDLVGAGPENDVGGTFIELHNPTGDPVSVGGWALFGCDATTGPFELVRIPDNTQISAEGFYLIADATYAQSAKGLGEEPDRDFNSGVDLVQSDGGVGLSDSPILAGLVHDVKWGSPPGICDFFSDAGVIPDSSNSIHFNTTPPPPWCKLPPAIGETESC